jgi:predicted MPP superfamily phosphohydrolase
MRRFFLMIFGTFFIANLVAWYALHCLLVRLQAPDLPEWLAGIFFLLQIGGLAAFIVARLLGHQPGTGMGRPLLSLIMIWNMLLVLPTSVLFVIWAVMWRLVSGPLGNEEADPADRPLGLFFAMLPFFAALLATAVAVWQLGSFRIRRVKLTIPHLPAALKEFSIVHLSDLHLGKLTRGKVLDAIVDETNRLNADVILLTGDLINMSLGDLPEAFSMLRAMRARHGLFLCEGNHDLIESRTQFEEAVKASGLQFLLNESATFLVKGQRVQILGLRWGEGMQEGKDTPGSAPGDALQQVLAQRNEENFTILLAHHPDVFNAAAKAGIPLTLAGHTHGGQLMLTPRIGFGSWLYRYWSGLYEKGESRLIVSNGVGNWFPLRIQAPAEIVHIVLR